MKNPHISIKSRERSLAQNFLNSYSSILHDSSSHYTMLLRDGVTTEKVKRITFKQLNPWTSKLDGYFSSLVVLLSWLTQWLTFKFSLYYFALHIFLTILGLGFGPIHGF